MNLTGGAMLGRVVCLALLPAGPAHATPGTGANRVGVLAASVARLLVDRAGPRVGVARGVSECDERLAQAHVATRHEPRTVVADLGEQGRGTDASLAEQGRDDFTVGVCVDGVLDGSAERRDLRDQRPQDGNERTYALALGLGLELAGGAARRGAARRCSSSSAPVRRPQDACRAMNAARRFSPSALADCGVG